MLLQIQHALHAVWSRCRCAMTRPTVNTENQSRSVFVKTRARSWITRPELNSVVGGLRGPTKFFQGHHTLCEAIARLLQARSACKITLHTLQIALFGDFVPPTRTRADTALQHGATGANHSSCPCKRTPTYPHMRCHGVRAVEGLDCRS